MSLPIIPKHLNKNHEKILAQYDSQETNRSNEEDFDPLPEDDDDNVVFHKNCKVVKLLTQT